MGRLGPGCVGRVGPIKDSLTYSPSSQGWAPRVLPFLFCLLFVIACLLMFVYVWVGLGFFLSLLTSSYDAINMFFHANGVVQSCSRGGPRYTVEMYGWSITIARCPCTPPSTAETCGEKISAWTGPGKEIAGLLKKKMMTMKNMMTPIIVKSRTSRFSRAKVEAGTIYR